MAAVHRRSMNRLKGSTDGRVRQHNTETDKVGNLPEWFTKIIGANENNWS